MINQYPAKSAHPQLELPSYETLSRLAVDEPQEYELLRQQIIQEFIATSPDKIKSRLLGIQFRIDGMRSVSKSPLGLTLAIYQMMWDCFIDLNQNWQEFVDIKNEPVSPTGSINYAGNLPHKSAQVLQFRSKVC
jgi:hypothetical protein